MHIFCDESGGIALANRQFTIATVMVDPTSARRAVRHFRKAHGWQGEIKGTNLTPQQRIAFVQMLHGEGSIRGAAVICARGQPVANWAMSQFRQDEPELYRHMLLEGLVALGIDPAVRGVTADQSRYKKVVSDKIATEIAADLEKLAGRRIPFDYGESGASAGLQVADVLCNTAGQLGSQLEQVAEEALAPLRAAGLLITQQAILPGLAPTWLRTGHQETELTL